MSKKETKKSESVFSLPKYLKLAKGCMWFDTEGENASGIRLFTNPKVFVGRSPKEGSDIPKDKFNNDNLNSYGWVDQDVPWYVDVSKIPQNKLSRVILAYSSGILVEADPNEPQKKEEIKVKDDFAIDKLGDRIFVGKNKDIYKRLQNMTFDKIKEFINTAPITSAGRTNIQDMLDYEKKGYNPLSRPRFEVLELLRKKLNEFGPGISPIRINEGD